MIETVDAEPIVFDFSASASASRPEPDTFSIYSRISNVSTHSVNSEDDPDLDDLKYYLEQLPDRPSEYLPPVAGGLPPLEALNIPYYDPLQVKFNPTTTQQDALRVEAKRGPRYMLMYLMRKLRYRPPNLARQNHLKPHSSAKTMATVASDGSDGSIGTIKSTMTNGTVSAPNRMPASPPLPPLPANEKPASPRFKFVSRLMHKKSASKVPPSPLASPPVSDQELLVHASDSDASLNGTHPVKPLSLSDPESPQSQSPTISKKSSIPGAKSYVPPAPSVKKKAPSILNVVMSRMSKPSPIRQIKRSHKYLANMGTIRLQGCEKRPFELIIDPRFPKSYIDIDALIRETTQGGKDKFNLLSAQFQIIATPVYNAESTHNRVCVDLEVRPLSMGGLDPRFRPQSITKDTINRIQQNPAPHPAKNVSNFTNQNNRKDQSARKALTYNTMPNFSLYSTIPASTQKYASKLQNHTASSSQPAHPVEEEYRETEEDRIQRLRNEEFESQWAEDSKDIITLMNLQPYNCILGRDWLAKLYEAAYRRPQPIPDAAEADEVSISHA